MVSLQGWMYWLRHHNNQTRSSGFWVISCSSLVQSIIGKSARCKKLRRQFQQQKMADLPKEKMSIEPPLTDYDIDIFRPFLVKDDWKEANKCGAFHT